MTPKIILSFIFSLIFSLIIQAQVSSNSPLYKTIISKDSLLFNLGFNTCDISQFENLLSENLKFYHDKDGISDKTKFLFDLKNGLCKNPKIIQVKRVLLKKSTSIFPLYKNGILYGAIQNGEHLFYETPESKPGFAKFSNVWILENGAWKLETSLSFDHGLYEEKIAKNPIFENDGWIEKWLKEMKIPALGLGVIADGKLVKIKVFGKINGNSSAPNNTIFNVASLTKPITAIVALKLISQNRWNLDEPIFKYFTDPDVENDPRNKLLTTRIILSHQTGFPNWRYINTDKKLSFQFTPGTKYQYSGEGYEYLRKALEKKFGESLEELAEDLIFKPLKMTNTSYILNKKIDISKLASGFDKGGKAYIIEKNSTPNAADDLLTTVEDYGNFLVSVMKGEGLSANVFKEMRSAQVASTKGKHFGLGLEIYNLGKGDYALSHGGADKGVQTIFFILPKTKQGLLIFTNVDDGYKVYEKLMTYYLGENGQKIFDIETK